jgi:maleate isomerase
MPGQWAATCSARPESKNSSVVFIAGNALRAIGVIAALEEDLRRPVLTANQVSLWYALRVAGTEVRVDGYGELFKMPRR